MLNIVVEKKSNSKLIFYFYFNLLALTSSTLATLFPYHCTSIHCYRQPFFLPCHHLTLISFLFTLGFYLNSDFSLHLRRNLKIISHIHLYMPHLCSHFFVRSCFFSCSYLLFQRLLSLPQLPVNLTLAYW